MTARMARPLPLGELESCTPQFVLAEKDIVKILKSCPSPADKYDAIVDMLRRRWISRERAMQAVTEALK